MVKDPFEYLDHVGGQKTQDFGEFLSWLSDEEKEIAIERNRRFMEEPGGPYDYDAIFAKIPQENFEEAFKAWGLTPKGLEKVASASTKSERSGN